jgi:hypothetical protein
VFKDFKVGEISLAWTEKPGDAVADRLREKHAKERKALRAATSFLQRAAPAMNAGGEFAAALDNVVGFLGAAVRNERRKKR